MMPNKAIPSVPITEEDFGIPDHWGNNWSSPSHEFHLTMSTTAEAGWLLYGLVRATRPTLVVETGTHCGLSSMFIGAALRDNAWGHLVTIDREDNGQEERINKRGLGSWVECILDMSTNYTPKQKIQFLFLDASHGYGAVTEELVHFQPFLANGALIAVDDSRIVPDEQDACMDFMNKFPAHGFQVLNSRGTFLMKYGLGLEKHKEAEHEKLMNFILE